MTVKVRDLMTGPAVTVGPDAPFSEVVGKLLDNDISAVVVVDDGGRLLGVISEADVIAKEAYGYRRRRALALMLDYLRGQDPAWVSRASGRRAAEIMSHDPLTARPDEDVGQVARRMLEWHHKRLPVVDGRGRVVGIVSRHDLLRPFHRSDEEISSDVAALLADVARIPESHAVVPSVSTGVVTLAGTVQFPRDVRLVETFVESVPGVVGIDNRLEAREPDPGLG